MAMSGRRHGRRDGLGDGLGAWFRLRFAAVEQSGARSKRADRRRRDGGRPPPGMRCSVVHGAVHSTVHSRAAFHTFK